MQQQAPRNTRTHIHKNFIDHSKALGPSVRGQAERVFLEGSAPLSHSARIPEQQVNNLNHRAQKEIYINYSMKRVVDRLIHPATALKHTASSS